MIQKISSLLSLVFISMAFSCSSDSSDANNDQTPSASITATVDGQAWASMTGGAVSNLSQISVIGESMTVLQIIGVKMDQSTLSLQFPINNLAVGT